MGCGGISSTNFYEASTSLNQREDVSSRRENCRLILHKKMQKSYHVRKLGMMICNRYVLTKLSRNARLISQCKINERNISHKHVKKEKLHVFICSFNKYLLSVYHRFYHCPRDFKIHQWINIIVSGDAEHLIKFNIWSREKHWHPGQRRELSFPDKVIYKNVTANTKLKSEIQKRMLLKIRKKTKVDNTTSSWYGASPSQGQLSNKSIRKVKD